MTEQNRPADQNVEPTQSQEATPSSQPPLKVIAYYLHSGVVKVFETPKMAEAITQYQTFIARAREDKPWVELEELHWAAHITFGGGKKVTVVIANGEKVLGRAAGVARVYGQGGQRAPRRARPEPRQQELAPALV
jgi:hypothetical protein